MSHYDDLSLYKRITDRDGKMEKERDSFNAQRKTICENFRYDLSSTLDDKGNFIGTDIIEGTGPWALDVMTRGFISSMVGRHIAWIRYGMRERFFKGMDEVNRWLQALEEQMYWAYRTSNYYDILPNYVKDGLSIGSPVMIADEDVKSGRTIFTIPHYTENFVSQNWFGEDDVYHRSGKWKINVKQLFEKFKEEDLPDNVKLDMQQGRHFTSEKELIMAIYQKDDPIFNNLKEEDGKYKPTAEWMQYYILKETDPDKERPLLVKPYFSKPFSCWHYHRNENECYARTPAWAAIFDTRGSNSAWRTVFEIGEYAARPAMWMMANQKGRVRFAPAGNNYARTPEDYQRPPVPIDKGSNYQAAMDFLDRVGENIKRHFHVPLFQMINNYYKTHQQPPTAYEIFVRKSEDTAQLIPAVQTFESGVLKTNDDRLMDIEGRAGRLPPPPQIVLDYSSGMVDPQFTGPLSMAQKMYLGAQRVQQGLMAAAPIFEIWPQTKYKVRASMLVEKVLEDMNFPQDEIVPEEEYQEIMNQIAQAEQQDRQLEQFERAAKAVPSISKDVEPDSPIAALAGATQ